MKLLLDENLSPRLVRALGSFYSDVPHVSDVGLASASDSDVWDFARARDLVIVSKDADFHQRSLVYGHPPKVVWIRPGNCSTETVKRILAASHEALAAFCDDPGSSFLVVD